MSAPDGNGLPATALRIVAERGMPVHLRLTPANGAYPSAACGQAIGEFWSGKTSEVSCLACLKHTTTPPTRSNDVDH